MISREIKVIFLDIDGVLNSVEWMRSTQPYPPNPDNHVDKEAMALLNEIVEKTGAVVVVSSTHRRRFKRQRIGMCDMLIGIHGFKGTVLDVTPYLGKDRGFEIQEWLDENAKRSRHKVVDYVILDDSCDMAHLMDKLVRTNTEYGLTRTEADQVIERLK